MRKLAISITILILLLVNSTRGQVIDDEFFSNTLGENKAIDVYLPPGYFENSTFHYPVIYFLHGWNGTENSVSYIIAIADSLMEYGIIEPAIIVGPNNNSDPFHGSFYTNSTINGDYETYSIADVIQYIDSNYRTYPHKNYRTLMGQSMGGYGCFRLGILHKQLFRGIAAHGSPLNFDFVIDNAIDELKSENQPGPPYFYDYYNTGIYTKMIFAMSAAFTPNPSTDQTYINPVLVEFPVDDQGMLIDSIYDKWKSFDPVSFVNTLLPSDSLAILFGDGMNDNLHLYPGNYAFKDTLDSLGLEYEFLSHSGYHAMPLVFQDRGLKFLDSIMPPPGEIHCFEPSDLQVSNITQTSAEILWSENWNTSDWKLFLGTTGFDTTGISPYEIDTNAYTVTNLLPNTSYEFYLQASCSIGGTSDWIGPVTFKTKCEPVSGTVSENFDTESTLPDCWTTICTDTIFDIALIDSLSSSGNNSVVIFSDSLSSGFCGLSSPEFSDLGSIAVEIRFSARTFSKTSELLIGLMEDPAVTSSWECIDTVALTNQFQNYRLRIDSITADSKNYFTLRHALDSAYVFIDDFYYTLSNRKLSGTFTYYNNQRTPLNDLSLTLMNNGFAVASATTDENGYYEFIDIPDGNYTIEVSTSALAGGINSLDAGKSNLWWTSPVAIEHIRWNAGDVNETQNINATDAGSIQHHFVYGTEFNRGEWTFWKQNDISISNNPSSTNEIIVNGENITQDFYGLCVGDFNGSYIPNRSQRDFTPEVKLLHSDKIFVGSKMEFELPVKVTSSVKLAAFSLIFEFPNNLITVEEIWIGDKNLTYGKPEYSVNKSELKIGWNSAIDLELKEGNSLITLKLKTTKDFCADHEIKLTLKPDPLNQLADNEFDPLKNITLSTNLIAYAPLGVAESSTVKNLTIDCYPNPFNEFIQINYSIPVKGDLRLELYNLNGILLKTILHKNKSAGEYSIKFNSSELEPGVYSVILSLKSGNRKMLRSVKIISKPGI